MPQGLLQVSARTSLAKLCKVQFGWVLAYVLGQTKFDECDVSLFDAGSLGL